MYIFPRFCTVGASWSHLIEAFLKGVCVWVINKMKGISQWGGVGEGGGISIFLCPDTKKVAGYYVISSEILSVRPSVRLSVSAPTIRLPATPPTVLGQSFPNFTGAFRMV